MKNNDIGTNIAVSGFENIDNKYEMGDNGQIL